jgi:hypothetical protein
LERILRATAVRFNGVATNPPIRAASNIGARRSAPLARPINVSRTCHLTRTVAEFAA